MKIFFFVKLQSSINLRKQDIQKNLDHRRSQVVKPPSKPLKNRGSSEKKRAKTVQDYRTIIVTNVWHNYRVHFKKYTER